MIHILRKLKKYGPFDNTSIEGGQYDSRRSWVHMTPEEAVQAHLDVNGKNISVTYRPTTIFIYDSLPRNKKLILQEFEHILKRKKRVRYVPHTSSYSGTQN